MTGTRPPRLVATLLALCVAACAQDLTQEAPYRTTLQGLALQDARTCDSGFEYPSALVDGLSQQLVEELVCMDPDRLQFYESCREPGCITADGPQPWAMRPELIDALLTLARETEDNISITAGYRDVAMQYYSRWYNENCSAAFNAAVPGESNHQGGRAIDVRFYDYWWDQLLDIGFDHPIPTDEPHFEWVGDARYRAESDELRRMSVEAFQRLWNRNHPENPLVVDGLYGPATKMRLGASPVDGFAVGACEGADTPDTGLDAGTDAGSEDATPADATPPDVTPTLDTGAEDTGAEDTSAEDTGAEDTGAEDTAAEDADPEDVASAEDATPDEDATPIARPDVARDPSGGADSSPDPLDPDATARPVAPRPDTTSADSASEGQAKRNRKSSGCAHAIAGGGAGGAGAAGAWFALVFAARRRIRGRS